MKTLCNLFFLLILSGIGVVFALPGDGDERVPLLRSHNFSTQSKEYYMSDQKADFIRPGLNFAIESYSLTPGGKLSVIVTFKDDRNQPLDRAGILTPGAVSMSFIFAVYDAANRQYTAYTSRTVTSSITGMTAEQAGTDSGGKWEDLEIGKAKYTFGKTVPADIAMDKTHTISMYGNRNLQEYIEKTYYDNLEFDFRPDGGQVTEKWEAIENATCNQCHDPLALHGGQRQDVKLCVQCHQPQSTDPDTGNTVDMKVMIHKIHMGEHLPSVQAGTPYQIIGFRNTVHDYSEVVFPREIRKCTTCHSPEAPEGNIYYTRPNRAACGSCHDNINWVTGEGHTPGAQADDSACAECHVPQGEFEFDNSILGAHTIPLESTQLAGLHADILSVTNSAPGQNPVVKFRVYNDDGSAVNPGNLNRMNLVLAGPNTDYAYLLNETATSAEFDGTDATYTFKNAIPAESTGSWTASADVYRNVTITGREGAPITLREAARNPVLAFSVTDANPVARRMVVNIDNCNECHDSLALHGGQRLETLECVMCHAPQATDAAVRPPEAGPVESINFKYMIHRIHTGEELQRDFTVYGYRSSVHNYNHVLFPGDRRNCEKCHEPGTQLLPLQNGLLSTITMRDFFTPMFPATAACLSCHDSQDAAAHAFVNTAPFGEACAACHGTGREHAVDKVHAR
ncbi:MAG: OmcA/MtrC family decaheme c-type cytochrome [Acidobacteria bacterium]|nr:OmcA/MtrC family decaheme c-type cytochrome [Acidobacteriota bacterium]